MKPRELYKHLSEVVSEHNAPDEDAEERKAYDEAYQELCEKAHSLFEETSKKGVKIHEDTRGRYEIHAGGLATIVRRRVMEVTFPADYSIQELVPDAESVVMQTMVIGIHDLEHTVDGKRSDVHAASCDIVTSFIAEYENPSPNIDEDQIDYNHPLNYEYVLERTNVSYPVFDYRREGSEWMVYDDSVDREHADDAMRRYQERGWEATFSSMHAAIDQIEKQI